MCHFQFNSYLDMLSRAGFDVYCWLPLQAFQQIEECQHVASRPSSSTILWCGGQHPQGQASGSLVALTDCFFQFKSERSISNIEVSILENVLGLQSVMSDIENHMEQELADYEWTRITLCPQLWFDWYKVYDGGACSYGERIRSFDTWFTEISWLRFA